MKRDFLESAVDFGLGFFFWLAVAIGTWSLYLKYGRATEVTPRVKVGHVP